jgi:ribosomal protein S17E
MSVKSKHGWLDYKGSTRVQIPFIYNETSVRTFTHSGTQLVENRASGYQTREIKDGTERFGSSWTVRSACN